ncbi:MAG: class I adenylate-forming enzyme family protein [bacterium]
MNTIKPISLDEFTAKIDEKLAQGGMFAVTPATIKGISYDRVFVASNMSLRDLLAMKATEQPDSEYIIYKDERYTIDAVWQQASQLANVLRERFSVQSGERVAIAMRNYPEWAISYIAIIIAGATAVPLNAWGTQEEMAYALRDCQAKIIFADAKRSELLAPLKSQLDLTLISAREETPCADYRYEEIIQKAPTTPPDIPIDADSLFSILYTSGSTGKPKGVMLTHRGILSTILSLAFLLEVVKELRPEAEITPEKQATLLALPLFHVTGSHILLLLSFLLARKVVFMYRWDVKEALRLIRKEDITSLLVVPTQSHEIVQAATKDDLQSLVDIGTGGAKRPAQHVAYMKEKFPNLFSSSGYGLTETNALGTHIALADYQEYPDSCGRAVPPVTTIKIINEEGQERPTGQVGEICIKSPANFVGYVNLPKETQQAINPHGWFRTGDLGYMDKEQRLFIVDRLKDIIIRGGENISCLEVENEIYRNPDIQEAAVFGVEDQKYGEIVGAVIVARSGSALDLSSLVEDLRQQLAHFKVPELIWISPQPLPRGHTNKIDKRTTRQYALNFPPHYKAR